MGCNEGVPKMREGEVPHDVVDCTKNYGHARVDTTLVERKKRSGRKEGRNRIDGIDCRLALTYCRQQSTPSS